MPFKAADRQTQGLAVLGDAAALEWLAGTGALARIFSEHRGLVQRGNMLNWQSGRDPSPYEAGNGKQMGNLPGQWLLGQVEAKGLQGHSECGQLLPSLVWANLFAMYTHEWETKARQVGCLRITLLCLSSELRYGPVLSLFSVNSRGCEHSDLSWSVSVAVVAKECAFPGDTGGH